MNGATLVEAALAHSTTSGCLALVHAGSQVNVRWAGNSLTTNGLGTTHRVTVIATIESADGTRVGSLTRAGVSEGDIPDLVAAAEAAARNSAPAEDAAPLLPKTVECAEFEEPAPSATPDDLAGIAAGLGDTFQRAESDGLELFGYAEHELSTTWLGSTTGLRRRHVQPAARVDMTAKSHGRTRSTWAGVNSENLDVDVAAIYDESVQRLAWQANPVATDPGRTTVLLSPSAVADLMLVLYWTAEARDAVEGRTVFSRRGGATRLGETITPRALRIWSDPSHSGLACSPFLTAESSGPGSSVFDNGFALPATDWIHDGRLAALWGSRFSAGLAGQPCTPPVDNLLIADRDGAGDLNELISRTDDALLITSLWYIREVDPPTLLLTGLTRDGVYRIRDGEVVGATSNYRFNESPVDLLARVTDVGASARTMCREWGDWFSRVVAPPMTVGDFNLSTRSQAS